MHAWLTKMPNKYWRVVKAAPGPGDDPWSGFTLGAKLRPRVSEVSKYHGAAADRRGMTALHRILSAPASCWASSLDAAASDLRRS
jgi:hypothetical protein